MAMELARLYEVLERTPAALRALLGGVSDFWVHGHYGPDTFSPFDVVGHLIHGERADWMARARIILESGPARPFDPFDRYAMYEASKGKTMDDLLATFAELRSRNLAELKALKLTAERLALLGMHPALGPVTLGELLATWAAHDLNHLHQVAKAMAYQCKDEVGAWRAYLTILPQVK